MAAYAMAPYINHVFKEEQLCEGAETTECVGQVQQPVHVQFECEQVIHLSCSGGVVTH